MPEPTVEFTYEPDWEIYVATYDGTEIGGYDYDKKRKLWIVSYGLGVGWTRQFATEQAAKDWMIANADELKDGEREIKPCRRR